MVTFEECLLVQTCASSAKRERKLAHSDASRYTGQPLQSSETARRLMVSWSEPLMCEYWRE